MWEPPDIRHKFPQVPACQRVTPLHFRHQETTRTLHEQEVRASNPRSLQNGGSQSNGGNPLKQSSKSTEILLRRQLVEGFNTQRRYVTQKAGFQPLAGVKGYCYETSKRVMKGGGDVGTITQRGQIPASVCQRTAFPQ